MAAMALLITYDLHDKTYKSEVARYLESMGARMVTESSYVVVTPKAPAAIVTELRAITHDEAWVYVFTIGAPFDGYGETTTNEWLNHQLG